MLNAFRHHGLYRSVGLRGRCTRSYCAQRLSASRIISGDGTRFVVAALQRVLNAFRHHGLYRALPAEGRPEVSMLCSTPFGITDYIGPGARRRSRARGDVLNAFRHHGLYRSARRPGEPADLGAQRLSASRIISVVILCDLHLTTDHWCSTPFGITDYIGGRRPGARAAGADVLNAFRHHGLYRSEMVDALRTRILGCSTPFGITDYIG